MKMETVMQDPSYILFDSGWAGPVLAISSDSGILAPFSLPGATFERRVRSVV